MAELSPFPRRGGGASLSLGRRPLRRAGAQRPFLLWLNGEEEGQGLGPEEAGSREVVIYPEEFLQSPGELSQALFSSDKVAVHVIFGKNWSLGRGHFWPVHLGI